MRDYMTIIKQYRDLPTHPYIFILTSPPLYMRTVMKEMLWDMQVMLSNLPPRHALTYLLIITTLICPSSILPPQFESLTFCELLRRLSQPTVVNNKLPKSIPSSPHLISPC